MIAETKPTRSRQLPPAEVLRRLRAHDHSVDSEREELSEIRAFYTTRWWDYWFSRQDLQDARSKMYEVEVNRLASIVSTYVSAIYPRTPTPTYIADASGKGDAQKASVAATQWMDSKRIKLKVFRAVEQAVMYPGVGLKLTYEPGTGSPLDRVNMEVVPWWELLLDREVYDTQHERFRGHVFYRSRFEVEKEYNLCTLKGVSRSDHLTSARGKGTNGGKGRPGTMVDSQDDNYVRVLHFHNLVDTYEDSKGNIYKGRYEVYVLDQGEIEYTDGTKGEAGAPVWCGPPPFADHLGKPLPSIIPICLTSEPEYPFKGIPPTRRMVPQLRELNVFRTFQSNSTKRDVRKYLYNPEFIDEQAKTLLASGVDMQFIPLATDAPSIERVLFPVPIPPMSLNVDSYLAQAEKDLDRAIGASPQARGQITKATAEEVRTTQYYTESLFGMLAETFMWRMEEMMLLFPRVLIAAMQDTGADSGQFEDDDDTLLAEVGADEKPKESTESKVAKFGVEKVSGYGEDDGDDESVEDGPSSDDGMKDGGDIAKMLGDITGLIAPMTDKEDAPPLGAEVDGGSATIAQAALTLVYQYIPMEVTVEDLDASFSVTFREGVHSPDGNIGRQQALMAIAQPYGELWMAVQKGGPESLFQLELMRAMAEDFDLPKEMHPDVLMAKKNQMESEADEPDDGGETPEGVAPEGAAPVGAEDDMALLQAAAEQDPEFAAMLQNATPEEMAQIAQTLRGTPQAGGAQPSMTQPPMGGPPNAGL